MKSSHPVQQQFHRFDYVVAGVSGAQIIYFSVDVSECWKGGSRAGMWTAVRACGSSRKPIRSLPLAGLHVKYRVSFADAATLSDNVLRSGLL